MEKRSVLLVASLIVVCVLVSALLINFSIQKPSSEIFPTSSITEQPTASPNFPTPSPTVISQVDYNSEVNRLLNLAIHEIEQVRNVTVPAVSLEVVSKDWAIQTWGVSMADADTEGILRQENIYKSLLMIPQNASLYQATVDWAGYYMAVVQSGKIYIIRENFNITNTVDAEATLVHELTHIMQNFYNIPRYYYSFDGGKAHSALTEGDASFTASYIKNKVLTTNQPATSYPEFQVSAYFDSAESGFYPSIPESVSKLNYFPYDHGEQFIHALFDRGGWATVNQAYMTPPNSTEQILHPEKYFAAESPISVDEVAPFGGNWTKTWSAQYGEFFILNMLSTNLTRDDASEAAAGWGGDKLAYYRNSDDEYLITWNICWDTSDDAGEFFIAFNNYMKNAGAQEIQFCQWQTNLIHQKIIWVPNSNTTLILATTDLAGLGQFS